MAETAADVAKQVFDTTMDVAAITTLQLRAARQWLERVVRKALKDCESRSYIPNTHDFLGIGWIAANIIIPRGQTSSTGHPLHTTWEVALGCTIAHNADGSWTFTPHAKPSQSGH